MCSADVRVLKINSLNKYIFYKVHDSPSEKAENLNALYQIMYFEEEM